jgi:hypothetical protein
MELEVFATPGPGGNSYLLRSGADAVLLDPGEQPVVLASQRGE